MARTRRHMTQEQFEAALLEVAVKLGNIEPVMKKFAKRYQATMRKNLRSGVNANGEPMAPLAPLTLQGNVTVGIGRSKTFDVNRQNFGHTPLRATGDMLRSLKAFADDKGWVAYVTKEEKKLISKWQSENMLIKAREPSGRAMARAMARKNMPVSPAKARRGFKRPARIPFALSSKQVKRSVTDLNKFVLEPLR